MTAETPIVSIVHRPLGRPGGPGPYGLGSTAQHSAYMQNIVRALMRKGTPEGKAFQLAWGILRNWAAGRDGHGGRVSAQVQAAAAKALAEETALRARAKATPNKGTNLAHVGGQHIDLAAPIVGAGDGARLTQATGRKKATVKTKKKPKLGSGARFQALKAELARRGAKNPAALAAYIGRKRYGAKKMAGLAAKKRKAAS